MIRIIAVALVILGLIAQPLMAAVPDSMPIGKSDHAATASDQPSQAPCHEIVSQEVAPESCTDCDSDCANGACASVCSLSTLAALNPLLFKAEGLRAIRAIAYSAAFVQELPSRIYHPPKHA